MMNTKKKIMIMITKNMMNIFGFQLKMLKRCANI